MSYMPTDPADIAEAPVILCFKESDWAALQTAFDIAKVSTGPLDGCVAGARVVKLPKDLAQALMATLVEPLRNQT